MGLLLKLVMALVMGLLIALEQAAMVRYFVGRERA
jgi:hypothetical protein